MDVHIRTVGRIFMLLVFSQLNTAKDNVQVEYFTTTTLVCDNLSLNLTTTPSNGANIQAKYWILPSGQKIDNTSVAEMRKGERAWAISDWSSYNITITSVDDEDFGVYYCVIVRNNYNVDIVKKGINEDGPDYRKLMERYRHNAMIGGIAAAVLFIIICGSCLLHHFRYGKKKSKAKKEGLELDSNSPGGRYYDNAATVDDSDDNKDSKWIEESAKL